MNKNFSDEQLDQILRQIVKDSVLSKDEIDEIDESPNLWWNVQRNIKEAKANRRKGWIPTWLDWRVATFASVALFVCFGLILFVNSRDGEILAEVNAVGITVPNAPNISNQEIAKERQIVDKQQISQPITNPKTTPKKFVSAKSNLNLTASTEPAKRLVNQAKVQPKTEEIKTDFIALNYSPAAESGQIMKVKVPRSMMVTLGVTTKLENSTELVNAEVLVGDDGLARAIRFIQ
ncbi:MAG TPA: hypothetical protein PKE69_26055 [Pyrinomonadaceae bacterium]|mgnify:CR=1 FL=1|nr:hypothetical protein [Pyrinomonadaceae bacterium]